MTAIFIIIGIALLVALSSFISSVGKLLDRRRKGINIVTKRGWLIISLNFGIIILSALQYFFNEKDLKQKDYEATKKQTLRDSVLKSNYDSSLYVLKNKFDTSNINTVSTISQTLGKYGYLFDSAQKRLVKIIRDSSKTKIIVQQDPILSICSFEGIKLTKTENGLNYFDLLFCSEGSGCTGFNINIAIVLSDTIPSNNYFYFKDNLKLRDQVQIAKDAAYVQHFNFSDKIIFKFLYIYVTGTYTNIDRSKSYKIDDIYYYNKIGKTVGLTEGETRKNIIKYIAANK